MRTASIVGVWDTNIKIEAMNESFSAYYTFYADGNFFEVNSLKETNSGVWMGAGNTYVLTFWGFIIGEQGQVNGRAKVRASIRMDDADHFTAHGVTDTFNLAGKVMENQFAGSFKFTGTCVEVELP